MGLKTFPPRAKGEEPALAKLFEPQDQAADHLALSPLTRRARSSIASVSSSPASSSSIARS